MTIIFFIIFYWLFSYLFLLSCVKFEKEDTLYKRICKCCILYIIGGFLFPMVLGDTLNDIIEHFENK